MLFVFDWDGTLVGKTGHLNENTSLGIKKIKELDHDLIIATGRHPFEVSAKIKENKFISKFLVGANGSIIINRHTDEIVHIDSISTVFVKQIIEELKKNKDKIKYIKMLHGENIYRFKNIDDFFSPLVKVPNEEFIYESAALIGVEFKNNDDFIKMIDFWNEKFKDELEITVSATNFLNFNKVGITKWSAVKWLLNHFDNKNIHVVAFGDSLNDYHMLKNANTAVVVGKKHPKLIKIGHFHIDHPDESGILDFSKKLEDNPDLIQVN